MRSSRNSNLWQAVARSLAWQVTSPWRSSSTSLRVFSYSTKEAQASGPALSQAARTQAPSCAMCTASTLGEGRGRGRAKERGGGCAWHLGGGRTGQGRAMCLWRMLARALCWPCQLQLVHSCCCPARGAAPGKKQQGPRPCRAGWQPPPHLKRPGPCCFTPWSTRQPSTVHWISEKGKPLGTAAPIAWRSREAVAWASVASSCCTSSFNPPTVE